MTSVACHHVHALLFGNPGELVSGASRVWRVAVDGFEPREADWPWGPPIPLTRGTRLRYDQRDYDKSWRHESWDRFCILDGEHAGRCVFISGGSEGSPVANGSRDIVPIQ
jgi:hypothetical protein